MPKLNDKRPLEERYRTDPDLLAFYRKKLLEPGWGGELDDGEINYIVLTAKKTPVVKRQWREFLGVRRVSFQSVKDSQNPLQG